MYTIHLTPCVCIVLFYPCGYTAHRSPIRNRKSKSKNSLRWFASLAMWPGAAVAGARFCPPPLPRSLAHLATVPLNKLHAATPNRFSPIASPARHPSNNTKSLFYHLRDIVSASSMKLYLAVRSSCFRSALGTPAESVNSQIHYSRIGSALFLLNIFVPEIAVFDHLYR